MSQNGNVILPDPLEEKHHTAAEALANGATNKAAGKLVGLSDSMMIRWKRHKRFRDLIEHYRPASRVDRAVQAQSENFDLLQEARDAEILLTSQLRDALERLIEVINTRLEGLTEKEIEDMAIRHLSPLLKVFGDGVGMLQNSHDRLTGYGTMIKELEAILAAKHTQPD